MKTCLTAIAAAMFVLAFTTFLRAENAKQVTLEGRLQCAHCALHEGDKCRDVLMVKEGDKDVRYDVVLTGDAKGQHVCQGAKNVKITGTVARKDGKNILTATKIEEIKA